jgi:hypothetical protein
MVLIISLLALAFLSGCLHPAEQRPLVAATPVPMPPAPGTVPVLTAEPVNPTPESLVPTPAPLLVRGEVRSFTFTSGGHEYSFSIQVPAEPVGEGPASCPLMSWRPGDEDQLAGYYAGIFRDPGQASLYDALLAEFHRIRRMQVLNDDEYLELLTHFVQQIPYDASAPVCPRRPDQVIRDYTGDCDEKSLLLLGLLDREGYDAAILLFPDRHHATAGIRILTDGKPSFRVYTLAGRKYVYVETTRSSFIGLYPDDFENADPVIIPTGNGTISYRAINDVMHIVAVQKRMEEKLAWINATGTNMANEIDALEQKLSAGTAYSTQEEWNTDYSRYSALVTQYNSYVDQFREIRDVYVFTLEHQDDRRGVSGRIANSKVENLL